VSSIFVQYLPFINSTTFNYIQLHSTAFGCVTIHYNSLQFITIHYNSLQFITLHYTALDFISYITMHSIQFLNQLIIDNSLSLILSFLLFSILFDPFAFILSFFHSFILSFFHSFISSIKLN
jgi:hypothetical protein